MQAASRFREDGVENPADGVLGVLGGARGLATITSSQSKYPDLILDGLAAAGRRAPGDADKF